MVRQKDIDFPGPGRSETIVSGVRFFPTFVAKSTGFFLIIFGLLSALGGLAQINPVWLYGPYNPAQVSSGSQPDWYMGVPQGSMRLFPSWEIRVGWHSVPPVFWPAVVIPTIMIGLAYVYPFVEARLTRDRAHHNLLQRPRDAPVRTSVGAMALTFTIARPSTFR